mgnify:CR=1 FL=1
MPDRREVRVVGVVQAQQVLGDDDGPPTVRVGAPTELLASWGASPSVVVESCEGRIPRSVLIETVTGAVNAWIPTQNVARFLGGGSIENWRPSEHRPDRTSA